MQPHLFTYILFFLFLAALGLRYCTWAFSSCGEWGLRSSCDSQDFSWLLLRSMGSRAHGLQQLQCLGLAALWHVESSWTRY